MEAFNSALCNSVIADYGAAIVPAFNYDVVRGVKSFEIVVREHVSIYYNRVGDELDAVILWA